MEKNFFSELNVGRLETFFMKKKWKKKLETCFFSKNQLWGNRGTGLYIQKKNFREQCSTNWKWSSPTLIKVHLKKKEKMEKKLTNSYQSVIQKNGSKVHLFLSDAQYCPIVLFSIQVESFQAFYNIEKFERPEYVHSFYNPAPLLGTGFNCCFFIFFLLVISTLSKLQLRKQLFLAEAIINH